MKGCTFPSMSLTPGSACSPNSPEVSSARQHPFRSARGAVLQEAACAGFGLMPACGRQLLKQSSGREPKTQLILASPVAR